MARVSPWALGDASGVDRRSVLFLHVAEGTATDVLVTAKTACALVPADSFGSAAMRNLTPVGEKRQARIRLIGVNRGGN